jgi:tRNA nucleotidyltransferase (CCA-adding enzyme)
MKEILKQVTELMSPHLVYAVGGCCRDTLLGNTPKDYDFTTPATPDQIEECVRRAGRKPFLVGKKFGTIGCKIQIGDKWEIVEITTFRTEKYGDGNRKPEVEFVTSINEDLSRRDFTFNAIAMRLKDDNIQIIDPFNGQEDLRLGIIKCVGFPKQRFKEDPLRILRAIRFNSRYGWVIEKKTEEKLCHCVPELLKISKERWMDEIDKILLGQYVIDAIDSMFEYKIWNYLIPELSLQYNYKQNSPHHKWTLDYHTELVVDKCPQDLNMRWAALLHDIAKPFVRSEKEDRSNYIGHHELGAEMVKRIALHLKWSNERTEIVSNLVLHHLDEDSQLRQYDNMGKGL